MDVKSLLSNNLRQQGFKLGGGFWKRKLASGVTQLASIRKSRWGDRHYLDVGVTLDEAHGEPISKASNLWDLFGDSAHLALTVKENQAILADDYPMTDEERAAQMEGLFTDLQRKFYSRFETSEAVIEYVKAPPGGPPHVGHKIKVYLGLAPPIPTADS
ncbi:MAG TPA: hypothetical protein VG944_07575 [Fimbriimonas sp.]|nr:hypothetical protein [Fimbriimonas sp.]